MDVVIATSAVDGVSERALEPETHLLVRAPCPLVEGVDLQPDALESQLPEAEIRQRAQGVGAQALPQRVLSPIMMPTPALPSRGSMLNRPMVPIGSSPASRQMTKW